MKHVQTELVDGVPVARIRGDVDVANVASIQQQLAGMLGPNTSSLIVDLTATRYLDSAGIDMLLRFSDRLDQRRAKLVLVIPDRSQLTRIAKIVGLPDAIAIYASTSAALQVAGKAGETTAPDPESGANQDPAAGSRT